MWGPVFFVLSFFRSFVLSFFRSFFGQFSIAPQCIYFVLLSHHRSLLLLNVASRREEKRGDPEKKIREKRQKEGFGDENTNGKERGASFENTLVQQKEKDDHKKVHTSFSRCVLYTLFP